jgi:hypothetical protein
VEKLRKGDEAEELGEAKEVRDLREKKWRVPSGE